MKYLWSLSLLCVLLSQTEIVPKAIKPKNAHSAIVKSAAAHHELQNFMQMFIQTDPETFNKPQMWHELQSILTHGGNFAAAELDVNTPHPATGVTMLYCATKQKMINLMHHLLKQHADPDKQDTVLLNTPMHAAAEIGDDGCIELLYQAGANLNIRNIEGRTPLHNAVLKRHPYAVATLISYGAHTTIRDKYAKTAIDYAKARDYQEIITLLE